MASLRLSWLTGPISLALLLACLSASALLGACSSEGAADNGDDANAKPEDDTTDPVDPDDEDMEDPDDEDLPPPDELPLPEGPSFEHFKDVIAPLLVTECGSCHLGERFGFASLRRAGTAFTDEEHVLNYRTFQTLTSLDSPEESRLLTKGLPAGAPSAQQHGGGTQFQVGDDVYNALLDWVDQEKAAYCADCGTSANKAYIAYVDMPALHWAANRHPSRLDWVVRHGAKIMLQPVDPATTTPTGDPVEFLPASFCGENGECDFGRMASNFSGTQLAFECRFSADAKDWLEPSWNLCLADIGADGKAVNPRFVFEQDRHHGYSVARFNPFGLLTAAGLPLRGAYDGHVALRKTDDLFPMFSRDDSRLIFSSRRPDPRSGVTGTRTYHGFEHTNNLISAKLDGTDLQTLYVNEGGTADHLFWMKNGNIGFHVWNLERMDRHLYAQTTADGMMEIPILFGRVQGQNMWGAMTQLAGGSFIGLTGRRRGSISNFVPFHMDHTLGTGLDPAVKSFTILDQEIEDEMAADFSYCSSPPNGANCSTARFYDDVAYLPDGRALITYNSERTYYAVDDEADQFWQMYGGSIDAVSPYAPALQVGVIDAQGTTQALMTPDAGHAYRYPAWVGKRQPPAQQPVATRESIGYSELHIADVPLWLSFRTKDGQNKTGLLTELDKIVALRVLSKEMGGNACTNDGYPYRLALYSAESNGLSSTSDHPTHLGINNATGYQQWIVPAKDGGDAYGDVPLQADKSLRLRIPSGRLLLFQGIDANGHVVEQRSRVFALPPGHTINASVKREYYQAQCSSCHGVVANSETYPPLAQTDTLPAVMDFATDAAMAPVVDLAAQDVQTRMLTYKAALRPILDSKCVSCHDASTPSAELTLVAAYSTTANYPAGKWAQSPYTSSDYLNHVPAPERVPAYNWSPSLDWVLDSTEYRAEYLSPDDPQAPMGAYAPWDPGYQSLFLPNGAGESDYLTAYPYVTNFGRGGRFSDTSYLIELLSGDDLDPRRSPPGCAGDPGDCVDHSTLLSEKEVRLFKAVIDMGFPYMSRCDDTLVTHGPNSGEPWGDPVETLVR